MKNNELRFYAVRDPSTGKFVSDLTYHSKRFWQIKRAAQDAIQDATTGKYPKYKSLELVTFKLVEVEDDDRQTESH